MPFETILALLTFSFVASVTPGPNNFMLLASGVNFGFIRTIPHMLGIAAGFAVLLLAVGFGLGALLTAYPEIHVALKIVGGSYLIYLAWKIATTHEMNADIDERAQPMTFFGAAAFQWVNPKAWMMAVTAMAVYASPAAPVQSVLIVVAVFTVANLPSISIWTGFGIALRGYLSDPVRLSWFNRAMGLALALTLFPMIA